MSESVVKDFKGKMDWVYVGKAEAPRVVEKKADTLWNEYMRDVLDIATPVARSEMEEASAVHGDIVEKTINQIIPPDLSKLDLGNDNTSTQDTFKQKFAKKWMEWEKKYSTPDHQNRLGKLLVSGVYMAGSLGLNMGGEAIAHLLYRKRDAIGISPVSMTLSADSGNKRMLDAGWEYLTDYGIEKVSDWSAKKITNREDVGFVSPLSRTIGKIGNTILNVTRELEKHTMGSYLKKSVLNPGFIEGAFRFTGAVPGLGFVKDFYAKANAEIMKGEGLIPLGADLAFNMMFAKVAYRPEVKTGNVVQPINKLDILY